MRPAVASRNANLRNASLRYSVAGVYDRRTNTTGIHTRFGGHRPPLQELAVEADEAGGGGLDVKGGLGAAAGGGGERGATWFVAEQ